MEEPILFKKQRELGAILGDTFKFLRHQWKPLFGLLFRIAGPALFVLVLSYVFYMQTMFGSLGEAESNPLFYTSSQFGASLVIALLLIIISGIVYYGLMYGTVMYAMKSYINSNGVIDKNEVIAEVRKNFWRLMGTSFLTGLITIFGFVFCIIPGIYFGVILASTYAILVFEKRTVTDAISYSFQLIKNEWWITFATLLVTVILYYIIIMIAQIPQYIYFFVKMFTVANTIDADPSSMFDWGYIALNAFAMIMQYLLYIIVVIATGFIYFNLNERKNFTGTIETIESLGQRE